MMSLVRRRALFGAMLVIVGTFLRQPAAAQTPVLSDSASDNLGIGDANADVVFTPLTPCRLIDTRVSGAGGALTVGVPRNYDLIGPAGYAGTGGNPSGCGIPAGTSPVGDGTVGNTVRALVLNFTAVPTAGGSIGNLRTWPGNQLTVPLASILNYSPVLYAIANGVTVATCDAAVASGNPCPSGDLNVQADGSNTDLVVDVMGYYAPQRRVLASNRTQFGVWGIDFVAPAALDQYTFAFAFHPPLPAGPIPEIIFPGFPPTPNCPGSVSNPLANPGYLCMYEAINANVDQWCVTRQLGQWQCSSVPPSPVIDPIGAAIKITVLNPGRAVSVGVWAVTAP